MPQTRSGGLEVVEGDLTRVVADAIVNAANTELRAGGGVCGAIFRAAGVGKLAQVCNELGHCATGSAVITPAFDIATTRHIIHAVGGGIQNTLLCRMIANATNVMVLAGPIEATAAGNVLVQLMAIGKISSIEEGRHVIRSSFPLNSYEPEDTALWDEAYESFRRLVKD